MSIYDIDREIETLEKHIDYSSVEMEAIYRERSMNGGVLDIPRLTELEILENEVLEKNSRLDYLYFHRNLIQNGRKYL